MYRLAFMLLVLAPEGIGQQRPDSTQPGGLLTLSATGAQPEGSGKERLAANDQIVINAKDVEGMGDRPYRIDPDGTVSLPLVGKIRALGLTVEEFEKELINQLGAYVRAPQVSVRRLSAQAETITAAGAFKNPGVYVLTERRSLLDVLSIVGGLQPNAARTIRITRRIAGARTSLPAGVEDTAAGVSTAAVNVRRLLENPRSLEILIEPNDILLADPAGVIYLTGEVLKPGTIEMNEKESLGLAELISIGGGFARDAASDKIKVLRPILNGSRRAEISVDVKSILDGRHSDFPVMPNDMVFVPRSKGKSKMAKTAALYLVPALTSTLIYVAVRR